MSGSKKPPSTALVPRAREPSDADLASMIVRSSHLFGRKKLTAIFDESQGGTMQVRNVEDADRNGSYLIYSETSQAFVGLARAGTYFLQMPTGIPRMLLIFYPAAKA